MDRSGAGPGKSISVPDLNTKASGLKAGNGPGGTPLKTLDSKSALGSLLAVGKVKLVTSLAALGPGDAPGGTGDTAGLKS